MIVTSIKPPDEPPQPISLLRLARHFRANSVGGIAQGFGLRWPPPPTISVRSFPRVWTIGAGYYDAPAELLDPPQPSLMDCPPSTNDGRVAPILRQTAQACDGNVILRWVAFNVYTNSLSQNAVAQNTLTPAQLAARWASFKSGSSSSDGLVLSQDVLTAMTQLAVTGSSAFAAWSKNPTWDLTANMTQLGMPAAAAATANQKIMTDFNAARQAVRNPWAGISESALRQGLKYKWIAVSGEDDPPDFPVNVDIAEYPQFHLSITVPTPKATSTSLQLNIRYIIASNQHASTVSEDPYIPPGDEVVIYIHGEGSRAEEALDFIPAIFSVGAAVGRSFTVIAFDQPSCGYSTMVPHLSVAPMPPTSGGPIDLSAFAGSPILDFVRDAIIAFVEKLMPPFGNPITAVVGGSLGGHMALRLASSQRDWVRNVIAWSPASVMEHESTIAGFSVPQRVLTDPVLAGLATDGPIPAWPANQETAGLRQAFFSKVWCQDTVNIASQYGAQAVAIADALISTGLVTGVVGIGLEAVVVSALFALTTVPPQPQMWYRDDWPSAPPNLVGQAKAAYIEESRRDRREVYNADFRRWHWRICEEMIGFKFDPLAFKLGKPLLLMVGEKDDYPEVHFFTNVSNFAGTLTGPGYALTVQDTGHSIHNERPFFLANQLLSFTPQLRMTVDIRFLQQTGSKISIQVTATDSATKAPIDGAAVRVGSSSVSTDGRGTAQLTFNQCMDFETKKPSPCQGTVTKERYQDVPFDTPLNQSVAV